MTRCEPDPLEPQFKSKLPDSRITGTCCLPETSCTGTRTEVTVDGGKLGVIEHIEKLCTELKVQALSDARVLGKFHVPIADSRTMKESAPRPQLPQWLRTEH